MMNQFCRRGWSAIGVDFGSRYVKALQLKRHARCCEVAAAVLYPQNGGGVIDDTAISELAGVLNRRGFHGRDLVLAVPRAQLKTGLIDLPPGTPGVASVQLSRMEIARIHRISPGSFELACWPVPVADTARKGTVMMANACSHSDADKLIDQFEAHDLNVVALDVTACALARACAPRLGAGNLITLIADLGWNCCRIVALWQGVISYERTVVETNLAAVRDRMADLLGDDAEAAEHVIHRIGLGKQANTAQAQNKLLHVMKSYLDGILAEILSCAQYTQRQYPDAEGIQVLVAGGGAGAPELTELLGLESSLPAEAVAPASLVQCSDGLGEQCASPLLTGALGLALHD